MGAKGGEKEAKEPTSPILADAAREASIPLLRRFATRKSGDYLTEEQEEAILDLLAMNDGHIREVARQTGVCASEVMEVKHAHVAAFTDKRERFKRAAALESQQVFAEATAQVRLMLPSASARDSAVIAGIYADKGALFAGDNVATIRHLHGVDPVALGDVLARLQSLTATSTEETGDIIPGTFTVKD